MIALSSQTRTAFRDLLNLAWPVILARIGIMTMGLTDAIVVGRPITQAENPVAAYRRCVKEFLA